MCPFTTFPVVFGVTYKRMMRNAGLKVCIESTSQHSLQNSLDFREFTLQDDQIMVSFRDRESNTGRMAPLPPMYQRTLEPPMKHDEVRQCRHCSVSASWYHCLKVQHRLRSVDNPANIHKLLSHILLVADNKLNAATSVIQVR